LRIGWLWQFCLKKLVELLMFIAVLNLPKLGAILVVKNDA
jgi:hypothetical protein